MIREDKLDTDQPEIEFSDKIGRINADLTIGVDTGSALPLRANAGLASRGMSLHGAGFIITPQQAELLGLSKRAGLSKHIRNYRNGRDLTARPRGVMVIDLFGLAADEVRNKFPEVYQHVKAEVKEKIEIDENGERKLVGRDWNHRSTYKENWWIFGEPRSDLRPALANLARYIATVETAKHRLFQFLDRDIIPDNMLVCIADGDAYVLGVLSSRLHVAWALRAGGWLGMGNDPRYSKSKVFDPFPFPSPGDLLKAQIRSVAEELDAFRKARQQEHPLLTLTQMYNVLEKVRRSDAVANIIPTVQLDDRHPEARAKRASKGDGPGRASFEARANARAPQDDGERAEGGAALQLTAEEERIKDEGLILILKELHEKLDKLVFEAYGWPDTLTDEEILAELVALNHERAAEEKRGHVRWLRPDYQIPRFGKAIDKMAAKEEGAQLAAELGLPETSARKPSFPSDAVAQTAAVFAALASAGGPVNVATIAANFRKTKNLERTIAGALASLHRLGHLATKDGKAFELRRVA